MSGRVEGDARVGNGAGLSGLREHICWAGVGAGRRGRGWAAHGPRGGRGQAGLVRSVGPGGEEWAAGLGWVWFLLFLFLSSFLFQIPLKSI